MREELPKGNVDERGHLMYEQENGRDTVELKGKGKHRGGQ